MVNLESKLDIFSGFIFDLDGTIYLGEQVLPGAVELVAELRRLGKGILFISNNPTSNRSGYAEKLTRLGIPSTEDDILTSGYVLARHLAARQPGLRLYVIGEPALSLELRQHGLAVVDGDLNSDAQGVIDVAHIDAVVVGFDRTLDYRKLNIAYQALICGKHFFATNADRACPAPGGAVPDAGATIAYLEHASGRKLELLAGKPSPFMLQAALERLHLPPESCLVVGDRLDTDIRMGQAAGMHTCLVLSGVTKPGELERVENPPKFVVQDLSHLLPILRKGP